MTAPAARAGPRSPRGPARELPLLLAGTLLIFVALTAFTVLSYRAAVERLGEERRVEAGRLASRLAAEPAATIESLARAAPPGAAVALLDAGGRALAAFGFDGPADLAPPSGGATTLGPREAGRDAVVAVAPLGAARAGGAGEARWLRLDLPARELAAQERSLARLTPIVVALAVAAAVLLLAVGRALVRPVETMLARARELGEPADLAGRDEIAFLLATFDRALAERRAVNGAAGSTSGESGERGDLASLHATLGPRVESGLLLLDRTGRVLAANRSATELLALAPTVAGEPLDRALAAHPELARRLAAIVAAGVREPRGEAPIERDGRALVLGVVAEPLSEPDGAARGWLVLLGDVTDVERRAAQERLAGEVARLGELAAGAAHELRNSVATLAGWLDLARRRAVPPDIAPHFEEMRREIGHLRRVVEDFLLFARPGTRRAEPLDLGELAERAARDPALGEIAATVERPATAPFSGDPDLLSRMLGNLVANAAEAERAAGRRGPVEIAVASAPGAYRLTVADRGPGIPPEVAGRLFEPFSSGRPGGAGLGLALCRRIALLHDGEITVGARPGGGTIAEVRLPVDTSVT